MDLIVQPNTWTVLQKASQVNIGKPKHLVPEVGLSRPLTSGKSIPKGTRLSLRDVLNANT
jgi:hypothetical protein